MPTAPALTALGCWRYLNPLQGETDISWKPEVIEIEASPVSKELKKRCSYFIRKVYETDPLACPRCRGERRIIAFVDQSEVIKKILEKELTFDPACSSNRTEASPPTGIKWAP